jgi:ATP-binding cassette subfamily B protein
VPEDEAAQTAHSGQIVFDRVSFRYGGEPGQTTDGEGGRLCLEDISFTLQRGGRLGIIGPTGCGKTTLLNLLLRFYDATQGHIFVDGRDVRTYDKDDLRRRFGVVLQNDMIFGDTLGENIAFGRDVSDQALRRAAEDAQAGEFIEEFPDQYRHRVAPHGTDLSGGQRQRLLIARALAADPEILILDDASSALDYRTDAALRNAIRTNHSGATTIVVAQRISSIMDADEILVLDEGRVLGRGTHAQLLESCGAYREIYKTQMGEGV